MRPLPARSIALRAALALCVALPAGAGTAAAAPSAERVTEPAPEVRDYWTPARMRAAEPVEAAVPPATATAPSPVVGGAPSYTERASADGTSRARPRDPLVDLPLATAVPDPSAAAVRMHGRVFFTIPTGIERGDYSCSGTAVDSANGRVVWTAGHCAYELGGGGYVKNWTFVPAYQDGAAPFGEWPAKRLLVTGRYHRAQDIRYDFAAANVARNASGQSVEDVVGARGIAFSQPRDQRFTVYGYPVEGLRFEGNRREYSCTGDEQGGDRFLQAEPRPMAIGCDMTGGASGGGWINAAGVLLSVTSYGYPGDPDLYGPYLGRVAEKVYDEAARKRKPKRGGHKGGKGGKKHGHHGHKGGKRHRGHRGDRGK
jgi:hypothetical protein